MSSYIYPILNRNLLRPGRSRPQTIPKVRVGKSEVVLDLPYFFCYLFSTDWILEISEWKNQQILPQPASPEVAHETVPGSILDHPCGPNRGFQALLHLWRTGHPAQPGGTRLEFRGPGPSPSHGEPQPFPYQGVL